MTREYNQMFHESHSWKKRMVFSFKEITPALAKDLLSLNTKNRPLKQNLVTEYVADMKAGKWKTNGDNIRISKTGVLLDSQHSLLAVITSGMTIIRNIVCGLDDDAFDTIDTGKMRSAGDTLAVAGHKNYAVKAGAAKIIMTALNGELDNNFTGGRAKYTNQEVLRIVEDKLDSSLFEEVCTAAARYSSRFPYYSPSSYAAFTYLFAEKNKELAFQFMDILTGGENISKTFRSPIYLLRKRLTDFIARNYTISTQNKYALLIKAWNKFVRGEEIAHLSWQEKETFPEILKPSKGCPKIASPSTEV